MKHLALLLIRIYQGVHLAFFRNCCRFHPTCSEYAAEAIDTHGLIKGVLLGSWRILRCQPFCKGGWDPVPPRRERSGIGRPDSPRRPLRPHIGAMRIRASGNARTSNPQAIFRSFN